MYRKLASLLVLLLVLSVLTPTASPRKADRSRDRDLPLSGIKIVIDPGHGLYYKNGGWHYQRPYCWGLVEDELTMDISGYMYAYLRDHTAAEVFVTRELDRNVGNGISGHPRWQEGAWCHLRDAMGYSGLGSPNQDLNIRPDYANLVGGDIFISVHTNAGGGSARGTMTLWGGLDAGNGGGSPANDRALAQDIHPPILTECGTADRGIWKDEDMSGFSLCVLRETDMPACLVEVAFHDNYDDNLLLHEEWFKEAAGRGMFFGIFDHYGIPRPDLNLPDVVHELEQITGGGNEHISPEIAELSNGGIGIVWEKRDGDCSSLMLKYSGDRGTAWDNEKVIVEGIPGSVSSPSLARTKDGTWFLAYVRSDSNSSRVMYVRSSDGAVWSGERELTGDLQGHNLSSPRVQRTKYGTLWCSFAANGELGGAYYCHSVNNGETFNSPTLLSGTPSEVADVYNTQTPDGKLWVLWSQMTGGIKSIHGTSSFSWDGWEEPRSFLEGNTCEAGEPALGEHGGELYLFYTSDRTDDGIDNPDVFYRTSTDNGSAWKNESLLTPNTDRDRLASVLMASDGRQWVVFCSQNGTGGDEHIYLTNNVTDAGNRAPFALLETASGTVFHTLAPTLEIRLLDHDGGELNATLFWQKDGDNGNNGPLFSANASNATNHTIETPLEDATWYRWWVIPSDGNATGVSRPDSSRFYVDVNYPPFTTLLSPADGSVFSWDTQTIEFSVRCDDADNDELGITLLISDGSMYPLDRWDIAANISGGSGTTLSMTLDSGIISPGSTYYWKVLAVDENGTEIYSDVRTFVVEQAPPNLPPVVEHIENRTVAVGDGVTFTAVNSTDPEGGSLYTEWWLFRVDEIPDPFNASFDELFSVCSFEWSDSTEMNITFGEKGTYLVQLNVSDDGAYDHPPGVTRSRAVVIVTERSTPAKMEGSIDGPGTIGTGILVKYIPAVSWGNETSLNLTWSVTLDATSVLFYSEVLEFRFSKPDNYTVSLAVLTAVGNTFEFRKNVSVISREEWDSSWSVVVAPGDTICPGNTFLLVLRPPSFLTETINISWEAALNDDPKNWSYNGSGTEFSFTPDLAGSYSVCIIIGSDHFSFVKELALGVESGLALPGPDDDGGERTTDRGTDKKIPIWTLVVAVFVVGVLVIVAILVFLGLRMNKNGDGAQVPPTVTVNDNGNGNEIVRSDSSEEEPRSVE